MLIRLATRRTQRIDLVDEHRRRCIEFGQFEQETNELLSLAVILRREIGCGDVEERGLAFRGHGFRQHGLSRARRTEQEYALSRRTPT